MGELTPFLEASVRLAVPLALAALGEAVSEKAGVINIGLEGSLIGGALGGAIGALATGSAGAGVVFGALAGVLVALVFAAVAVGMGGDQIITGTAVTLGGLGATGVAYQEMFGATGTALTLPTLSPVAVPGLSRIPVLGSVFFQQAPTAYLAYALAPALWYLLFRTRWGLAVRAVGEAPDAAAAAGVRVRGIRTVTVLLAGALAGIAGAHLSLAHAGTFAEGMSAGRGFIAIAVVASGPLEPDPGAVGRNLLRSRVGPAVLVSVAGSRPPVSDLPRIALCTDAARPGGRSREGSRAGRSGPTLARRTRGLSFREVAHLIGTRRRCSRVKRERTVVPSAPTL